MNRQPIYHQENDLFRVISCPNGQWVAQTKDRDYAKSNQRDPWSALHSPATQDAALAYMLMKCPLKE